MSKIIWGIGLSAVVLVGLAIAMASSSKPGGIPGFVKGETRATYEWARTAEGTAMLEQMPC